MVNNIFFLSKKLPVIEEEQKFNFMSDCNDAVIVSIEGYDLIEGYTNKYRQGLCHNMTFLKDDKSHLFRNEMKEIFEERNNIADSSTSSFQDLFGLEDNKNESEEKKVVLQKKKVDLQKQILIKETSHFLHWL